jgi:predicted metallopeptidase
MRRLCVDMVRRVAELGHIDMSRVAVGFCQARTAAEQGIYATMTPLRFAGGHTQAVRRGRTWGIQRLYDASGREMLYILSFYLPRYLDLPLPEKLNTVAHELWHIGPSFDGDLRRFQGRCKFHSGSKKRYNAQSQGLVDAWLAGGPDESLYGFLQDNFQALSARHGRVFGTRLPAPKIFPIR